MSQRQLNRIEAAQGRIEAKLDELIAALATTDQAEQDADRGRDLEGNPLPADRDPDEAL